MKILISIFTILVVLAGCAESKKVIVKKVSRPIAAESVKLQQVQNQIFVSKRCCETVGHFKGNILYHRVKCGENLSRIAWRYGIPLCRIIQLNQWIKNPDYIRPGWSVRVR